VSESFAQPDLHKGKFIRALSARVHFSLMTTASRMANKIAIVSGEKRAQRGMPTLIENL
jgi:hypothetical protein